MSGPTSGEVNAFGMPATRATTAEQFSQALARTGPHLIDATIPPAA
ncbi:hypothetical protein [Micromonospora zamorensis]